MAQADNSRDILIQERAAVTRLAMWGRLVVIAVLGLWVGLSRPPPIGYYSSAFCLGLALLAFLHLRLVERYERWPWLPYAFYALDTVLLIGAFGAASIIVFHHIPAGMIYHFNYFPFVFLILISTGLSLSPKVVLWTGACIAVGWMTLFRFVTTPESLDWDMIPQGATGEEYLSYILSPQWTGFFSRFQEMLVVLAAAGLLALVVHRMRRMVARQIAAERGRRQIREAFGQYVPDAIADAMIAAGGILPPQERLATVLFCDLAGFTSLTHRLGPERTVQVLNAYFDAVSRHVGDHGGVVTQFQGDAALAVFNAPSDLPDHAAKAVDAGLAILKSCSEDQFDGERLTSRIGIATGPLVAGSVGGAGRRGYTVHGDTVNLAARLEALNKETGTALLMNTDAAAMVRDKHALRTIDDVRIAGRDLPMTVFTPAG